MCEETKVCFHCKEELPVSNFTKSKDRKDGLASRCKLCLRIKVCKPIAKEGYKFCSKCGEELLLNLFRKDNATKDGKQPWCKDCYKLYMDKYRIENTEQLLEQTKKYREENPEAVLISSRKWRQENPDKIKEYKSQPHVKVADNMRARLRNAIKGHVKTKSAIDDLGCSINWFKDYIE